MKIRNPLIVGYKGEIGSFILQGLLRVLPRANNIWCYDINDSAKDAKDRIKKADVIFLCLPMQKTVEWFITHHKDLKGKTVIEQTSLKSILFEPKGYVRTLYQRQYLKGINILSMHILFRPSATPNREDRAVAFIDPKKWDSNIKYLIQDITDSYTYFYYDTYSEHDKEMAIQQALVHRVILNLSEMIGNDHKVTYMGKKVRELANRIKSGDKELYKIIQDNPHATYIITDFTKKMKEFNV